uniref:Uncharacterized protein n=1 Tax=Panagrellus redivivus TaxID=6233 RepID=A0A7E4WE63_PANRE
MCRRRGRNWITTCSSKFEVPSRGWDGWKFSYLWPIFALLCHPLPPNRMSKPPKTTFFNSLKVLIYYYPAIFGTTALPPSQIVPTMPMFQCLQLSSSGHLGLFLTEVGSLDGTA